MLGQINKDLKVDYDQEHDVLYVSVGNPTPSYSNEENIKGLFIRREIVTDKITGVTILDYSKRNKKLLANYIPFKVDFNTLI